MQLENIIRIFISDPRFEVITNRKNEFFEDVVFGYCIKLKLKKGNLKLIYRGEQVGFTDEDPHERLVILEPRQQYYIATKRKPTSIDVLKEINKAIERQTNSYKNKSL